MNGNLIEHIAAPRVRIKDLLLQARDMADENYKRLADLEVNVTGEAKQYQLPEASAICCAWDVVQYIVEMQEVTVEVLKNLSAQFVDNGCD